ncbi:Protein of unknown function DUF3148 [Macleaya cordata]|uniref:Chlororespiratory reduction 42 n=1 Tax=Macleaya cordata TaxID=56857 RepID=A0A200QPA1_MACCD|nr:Protein of unknown function DUF3148 [Macleaya cordata]
MALYLPTTMIQSSKLQHSLTSLKLNYLNTSNIKKSNLVIKCEASEPSDASRSSSDNSKLQIGSAIIVVDAPQTIKTAASIPCLRVNTGFVKPGDVGRIVARKPKDVWAVRLTIGTYLIDGKHFRPLEIDE